MVLSVLLERTVQQPRSEREGLPGLLDFTQMTLSSSDSLKEQTQLLKEKKKMSLKAKQTKLRHVSPVGSTVLSALQNL